MKTEGPGHKQRQQTDCEIVMVCLTGWMRGEPIRSGSERNCRNSPRRPPPGQGHVALEATAEPKANLEIGKEE